MKVSTTKSSQLAIDLKGIVKKYGDHTVISGVDLQVHRGECFGLLGPNGAGKSSLLRILSCQSQPTSGEAYVLGLNIASNRREAKARMGVVTQENGLEMSLTVMENLELFARYFGYPREEAARRAEDVCRIVRLEKDKDKTVSQLSGGWQRRVAMARGLINKPDVLILDEPTQQLDPIGKRRMWELLRSAKAELGTLLMCTHDMSEAETLCDRVALMSKGRLIAQGKPHELIRSQVGESVIDFELKQQDFSYYLSRLKEKGFSTLRLGNTITVSSRADMDLREAAQIVATDRMTLRKANLNDVFLRLTGSEISMDELGGEP